MYFPFSVKYQILLYGVYLLCYGNQGWAGKTFYPVFPTLTQWWQG